MMHHSLQIFFMLFVFIGISCQAPGDTSLVRLIEHDGNHELYYKGNEYFIKGVVTPDYFEQIRSFGANSVRTGSLDNSKLDLLDSLGLTVLYGLPVKPERSGMDYNDSMAVNEQFRTVISRVREMKDHPSILFWQLGNELDFVDPETPPNWKVYDAINDMAREIHRIDPGRPVLTVLGTGKKWKLGEFIKRCPDLDLVGINAYGDIGEINDWFNEYEFNKPFIVTEWGPVGHWQVPRNHRGLPIEQNSTEKAASYRDHYEAAVLANPGTCLGSYVFYWQQKQERTHTWYGMFDKQRRMSAAVDVMRTYWTNSPPPNLAPEIESFSLDGNSTYDSINLVTGKTYTAQIQVNDPDGDSLSYFWEVLPENSEFGYGGQGEEKPEPVNCIIEINQNQLKFSAPQESGDFRLYVTIYDYPGNHFSYANIPFYVPPSTK